MFAPVISSLDGIYCNSVSSDRASSFVLEDSQYLSIDISITSPQRGQQSRASGNDKHKFLPPRPRDMYWYNVDTISIQYRYNIDTISIRYRYDIDTTSKRYQYNIDTLSIQCNTQNSQKYPNIPKNTQKYPKTPKNTQKHLKIPI